MNSRLLLAVTMFTAMLTDLSLAGATLPVGAQNITPLPVGSRVPAVRVETLEGKAFDLAAQTQGSPTIIIFYRGGWCPYCNLHLAQLQEAEPKLLALGYRILAVSSDRPENLQPTIDKHNLTYTLLSDRKMVAASAFGVAFKLPEDELKRYESFHVDVPPIPGDLEGRWLPVPSVFIVDRQGEIKFVHWDPDFKKRISMPDLLAAASAAAK